MTNFFYKMFFYFRDLIESFFSVGKCLCCSKMCPKIPLCKSCQAQILKMPVFLNRCKKCGRKILNNQVFCVQCKNTDLLKSVDKVLPLYAYFLPYKNLLHFWKQKGYRSLGALFAKLCFEVWKKEFNSINMVAVPPRPKKIFNSGWDQITDLSIVLKEKYKVPFIDVLVRLDKNQQKYKNKKQRLDTYGDRYALKKSFKGELPKEIVLIDDIMTTGATIQECAEVLKKYGVEKVYAITIFYVPSNSR